LRKEQRSQRGCIAVRMQMELHHGLLAPFRPFNLPNDGSLGQASPKHAAARDGKVVIALGESALRVHLRAVSENVEPSTAIRSPLAVAVIALTDPAARPLEHSVQRARSAERNTPSHVAGNQASRKRTSALTPLLKPADDHVIPRSRAVDQSRCGRMHGRDRRPGCEPCGPACRSQSSWRRDRSSDRFQRLSPITVRRGAFPAARWHCSGVEAADRASTCVHRQRIGQG
jgi:hypothetical protein